MKKKSKLTGIKELFGYLLAIFFIVLFALYCSGRVGWFLLIVAVIAPLFSAVLTKIFSRMITLKADIEETVMTKKNHCALTVSVTNKAWLPTPEIEIIFEKNDHFKTSDKRVTVSVPPRKTVRFQVDYEAVFSGGSILGISKAYVRNYLGSWKTEIQEQRIESKSWKVGIIPEISTISNDNPVIKNIFLSAMSENSNDETIDETSLMFGGFPGYEYREYQPGDPLKRINSKLSAKKGTLMVRLDERMAAASVAVVLDSSMSCENTALMVQSTLETVLGLAKIFLLKDYAVEMYVHADEYWERHVILQDNDLVQISKKLATYTFSETDSRFPDDIFGRNTGAVIYCTPSLDSRLESQLQQVRSEFCDNLGVYEVGSGEGGSL
ncbi:MAG: DUF58 domain-containing protein [Lachnospira sp.]